MSSLTVLETLTEIERQQPGMVRLAELLSLAVRIEPVLLRQVRREFAPDLGPEVEAELWFGPLVESYGATGFVLDPEFAEILRHRLASRPAHQLERVAASIARCRADAPESIRIEEKVTALALLGASTESIEEGLRPAVLALRQPERSLDVSRWLSRALPRLPAPALRTEAALMLALGASANFGGRRILEQDFDGRLPANAGWALPVGLLGERVKIGVRVFDTGLEILADGESSPVTLELPPTNPLWLEISWKLGATPFARTVQVYPGRIIDDLPPNATEVRLRTLAGDVYSAEMRTADSSRALQRIISANLTLAQIGELLTEVERNGLDQGGGQIIPVRLTEVIVGRSPDAERANIAAFRQADSGSSERIILVELSTVGGMESFAPRLRREGVELLARVPVLAQSAETDVAICRVSSEIVLRELLAKTPATKVQVFLSHSRGDSEFARRLETDLSNSGIEVWSDQSMLKPDQDWRSQAAAAVKNSDLVLLILGRGALGSEAVRTEYRLALEINKPLIPVLWQLDAGDIPEDLRHIQFIIEKSYQNVLAAILKGISRFTIGEKKSPEQRALGVARALQSIALPFHVHFRGTKIDPERAKRFWEDFDRRRILSAKQFDRVRGYCEWIIQGMVEEFIAPAWTQTSNASPRMTFVDFVEAVTTEALRLAKTSTEQIKSRVTLRPGEISIYQDLLVNTGLVSQQSYSEYDFILIESKPGTAASALKRFSRELRELLLTTHYDPWAAPSLFLGNRLPVLAALVSAICRPFLEGRENQSAWQQDVAHSLQRYVTPLWQEAMAELLALETPGFSSQMDFRAFLRAFNETVVALLDEAVRELGDFEMDSYPLDDSAAEEMRRLAPEISVSIGNDRAGAKGRLSQFLKVFRRAANELIGWLDHSHRSSTGTVLP